MDESYIYNALGQEGISKIVAEFYKIMREDDLVGKMYPDNDWEGSEERLRDFLLFRLGGDQTYMKKRGHPRLRMRHAHFFIGEKESARWVEIMDKAMEKTDTPADIKAQLHDFFTGVAEFMRNH